MKQRRKLEPHGLQALDGLRQETVWERYTGQILVALLLCVALMGGWIGG